MDSMQLPAQASAIAAGRTFARDFCLRHELSSSTTDDVVLLVSELVTNAYLHARSGVHLTLDVDVGLVRIEASDDSPILPIVRQQTDQRSVGRGLVLLDGLARRWGVQPAASGKLIWVEIDLPP